MDPVLDAAARALGVGDTLTGLKLVALRDDAPALALRGIALAQLGELKKARQLLRRAARGFGEREALARARCAVAEAEIALLGNDLSLEEGLVERAAGVLSSHGDSDNALFARLLLVRRWVLLGQVERAQRMLAVQPAVRAAPRSVAMAELVAADIAVRQLDAPAAAAALARARKAALAARILPLWAEVEGATRRLSLPVARVIEAGGTRALKLAEVSALLGSNELVIDACRREARQGKRVVSLTTRPVLFALALALAEHAPGEVSREGLISLAFGLKRVSEAQRVRLRVEIGRLRKALAELADVSATAHGYALTPRRGGRVHALLPPEAGEASSLLGLLSGGGSWSTSDLAAALGKSQRGVQRALGLLETAGKVRAVGKGRGRRWVAPPPVGFATTLLLVARGALS